MSRNKAALFMAMVYAWCCNGQDKMQFGLATNLGKLYLYTGQLDVLVGSKDAKWMGLLGVLYTNGHIDGGNKRPIEDNFMITKSSRILGWGTDMQVRYKVLPLDHAELGVYLALGVTYNKYRVTFFENQYNYDPGSGMYHYGLATYKTSFSQTAVYGQVFFSANIFKRIHTEIGAGVAHNTPKTSDVLDTYRNFGENGWGFAMKGLSTVITCRLGYWLYR